MDLIIWKQKNISLLWSLMMMMGVINYLSELPFYGSNYLEAEGCKPPLVLDDTSNVSWLVGPIAKPLNAFCCLEISVALFPLLLLVLLSLSSLSRN